MILNQSLRLFLTLACAASLAACNQQPSAADTAAATAAMDTAAAGWEKAYNDKSAEAVAAIYTEDAQLLPPGAPFVNGRAAIRDYFANDIEKQWAKISVKSDANGLTGDWAWRSGTWSVETDPVVTGKYIEVWRKTQEGWHLHRDIWNVDAAADAAVQEITVN